MSRNEILSPAALAVKGYLLTCNPWTRLGIVLQQVFDRVLVSVNRSTKITGEERDDIIAKFRSCDHAIRATSVSAGIPFEVFDSMLADVGGKIQAMIGRMNTAVTDLPGIPIPDAITRIGQLGITWQGTQTPTQIAAESSTSPKSALPEPILTDGPDPGGRIVWKGRRHEVPLTSYRMIAFMWNRESARYEDLDRTVFDDPVEPQTIRSRVHKSNSSLAKIGVPWCLHTSGILRRNPSPA